MGCLHLFNIVLFLGVFVLSREAKIILPVGCKYDFCSYTGDPHLTPFSQPYVYWCQKPGWELLLSNQYVTIYVLVDAASFYAIIDVSNRILNEICSIVFLDLILVRISLSRTTILHYIWQQYECMAVHRLGQSCVDFYTRYYTHLFS